MDEGLKVLVLIHGFDNLENDLSLKLLVRETAGLEHDLFSEYYGQPLNTALLA
jgi:hypothetical protein